MNNVLPEPMNAHANYPPFEQHQSVWTRIEPLLIKQHLPPAFLFSGPRHLNLLSFLHHVMTYVLCENAIRACGTCQACHLLKHNIHPDITYLGFNEETLKIEEVRNLQRDVFQTPQRGQFRFVVILAQKLHISVSNALLKILEEPPSHTCFILISETPQLLPLTIISRCRHEVFFDKEGNGSYLMLARAYPEGSKRHELFLQQNEILSQLCDMLMKKISVCTLAQKWATLALEDILWFMYLLTAEAARVSLLHEEKKHVLSDFIRLVSPVRLLTQLQALTMLMKKNNQNIAINATLALESLLLGYMEDMDDASD